MKRFLLKIAGTAGSLKLLTFVTLGLSITAPATLVADQDDANDSNEDLTIEEQIIKLQSDLEKALNELAAIKASHPGEKDRTA